MDTILIIDDSRLDIETFTGFLKQLPDCQIICFEKSAEAIVWCRDNVPDLVVLDCIMPEPDGLQFIRIFRELQGMEEIPVIMVSARDNLKARQQALELRANDFLIKPIDGSELLARVRTMLGLRASQRELSRQNQKLQRALANAADEKARTDAVIAAIGDGLSVQNREYRIIYQNQVLTELIGDHVGEYCYQVYRHMNQEGVCEQCQVAACFADGKVHTAERNVDNNGAIIFVENTASPIRNADGEIVAAVEVVRDVTRKKEAERKLVRQSNLYEALSHTNKAIMRKRDRSSLLQEICRIAVEYGKFCLACIAMIDEQTGLVKPVVCSGQASGYLDSLQISLDAGREEGRGPTGIAIREGKPYVCNDFSKDPATLPWREAALANGIQSSAAFPLKLEGRAIGALKVYAEQTEFFDEEMTSLLEEMAGNISFAFDNFSREEQRRQAEKALSEREERLKMVLEGSNDGFWDWDIPSGKVEVSRRFLEMLGYQPGELASTAEARQLLIHPDDRGEAQRTLSQHLAGDTPAYEVEIRMQAKDGEWKWILDRGKVVERAPEDEPLRMAGTTSDITERKRYEENLHYVSTHDPLTGLFNRAFFDAELSRMAQGRQFPVSIVIADIDGLKLVNDSFGHAEGDRLIRQAAQAFQDTFRAEDLVARIGGDEFAILLPETDMGTVKEAVKRVLRCQALINEENSDYTLSISIGTATAEKSAELREALKLADSRMYYYKFQRKTNRG